MTLVRVMLGSLLAAAVAPVGLAQVSPTSAPAPVLHNPGFEVPAGTLEPQPPEGWSCFTSVPGEKIGVTAARPRNGSQSLVFKPLAVNNVFEGAAQEFAAVPAYHYEFAVYVTSDPADRPAADSFGQVHFEWRGADGKEVGRIYGPTWTAGLSAKQWERFFVEGDAPETAASGLAVIMFYSKSGAGRGTFHVDDCEFTGGPPRQGSTSPSVTTSRMKRLEMFRQTRGAR